MTPPCSSSSNLWTSSIEPNMKENKGSTANGATYAGLARAGSFLEKYKLNDPSQHNLFTRIRQKQNEDEEETKAKSRDFFMFPMELE